MGTNTLRHVGAIVLSAGRGTRMKSTTSNKVMLDLAGKPMLSYTIDLLEYIGARPIVVVVGFGKEEIIRYFKDRVVYAIQDNQLGTGHAAGVGLDKIHAKKTKHVLLLNGDDSYNYTPEILKGLINTHKTSRADISFITITLDNPYGIGRVIRDDDGTVARIVEEKNATKEQKKITEVSPQCWVFKTSFLKEFIPKIAADPVTNEYYVNSLLTLAVEHDKIVVDVPMGYMPWRGVNKPEELAIAKKIVSSNLRRKL